MLRQQHFLYQRKNLHIPILGRIFSGEPDSDDNHWSPFQLAFSILSSLSPYFILGSGRRHWRQWPIISAEREPVGYPWQYKFENNDGYEKGSLLILLIFRMMGI